jgi:hypothetical protein
VEGLPRRSRIACSQSKPFARHPACDAITHAGAAGRPLIRQNYRHAVCHTKNASSALWRPFHLKQSLFHLKQATLWSICRLLKGRRRRGAGPRLGRPEPGMSSKLRAHDPG